LWSTASAVKLSLDERPVNSPVYIDKPEQKYVPLSDQNSAQIHTGKEVKGTLVFVYYLHFLLGCELCLYSLATLIFRP